MATTGEGPIARIGRTAAEDPKLRRALKGQP